MRKLRLLLCASSDTDKPYMDFPIPEAYGLIIYIFKYINYYIKINYHKINCYI